MQEQDSWKTGIAESSANMSLQKLTGELYQLYESEKYAQCQKILTPIKVELIKHNLLVPLPSNSQNKDQLNDLKIAERILEIGSLSSLLSNDYQGFENCFAQLRPFYNNEKLHSKLEVNTDCTKIISLYLLYLLSRGLISKFHVELENIFNKRQYNIEKDSFLQFPVNLERNLMEGNYNKIWKLLNESDNKMPCKEYKHFNDTLITALRFEIAKSLERTYESLPVSNCKNLLYFPQEQSDAVFQKFCEEDLEIENWKFQNGTIVFNFKTQDELNSDNSNVVINNVLNYAEQIESIV